MEPGKQFSSVKPKQRANKNTPVCRGCGEAFENRQVADEAHGKKGCGTETGERGYEMRTEKDAW